VTARTSGDCSNGLDPFTDLNHLPRRSGDSAGLGVDGAGEAARGDANGEDRWEGLISADARGVAIGVDATSAINNSA
jgi:hypothetical protein